MKWKRPKKPPASRPDLALTIPIPKNLPRMLLDAIKRCARIVTHPQSFPELIGKSLAPRERVRKRRPERLEACALVAMNLIRRTDRRTYRVGDQRLDGLCTGVSVADHVKATGLSPTRVRRALPEFEGWGIHTSVQPVTEFKKPKTRKAGDRRKGLQRYAGLPAVRTVTPLLMQRLGITPKKQARARRAGYQDWQRRKARPLSAVAIKETQRALRRLGDSDRGRAAQLERGQRLRLKRIELRKEHPDWGPDRIRDEAGRLLND